MSTIDYPMGRDPVFEDTIFGVTEPSSTGMKIDTGVKHGQTIKAMGTELRYEGWLVEVK